MNARGPPVGRGILCILSETGLTLNSLFNLLPLDYTRSRTFLQLRESGEL